MALREGRLEEARTLFQKTLNARPRDVEAQRGLRLAESRIAKQDDKERQDGSVTNKLKSLFGRK